MKRIECRATRNHTCLYVPWYWFTDGTPESGPYAGINEQCLVDFEVQQSFEEAMQESMDLQLECTFRTPADRRAFEKYEEDPLIAAQEEHEKWLMTEGADHLYPHGTG